MNTPLLSVELILPIRSLASASASAFHLLRTSTENLMTSLSISFAQFWHNQIPFDAALRSSGERSGSKRGPPGDAAVMWAATPKLTAFAGSLCGPLVGARHSGLEQTCPARDARILFIASEKSSLINVQPSCPASLTQHRRPDFGACLAANSKR